MSRDLFLEQVALPVATFPQRVQAFGWSIRRHRALTIFVVIITLLGAPFCAYFGARLFLDWEHIPALILAVLSAPVALIAFPILVFLTDSLIAILQRQVRWATPDARIGIWSRKSGKKPGWYASEHIARPGVPDAGQEIRLLLRQDLLPLADANGIWLYASTGSEKLAARYCEDIPGLRIVRRTLGGRIIHLERPPQPPSDSGHAID